MRSRRRQLKYWKREDRLNEKYKVVHDGVKVRNGEEINVYSFEIKYGNRGRRGVTP